jgi:molybdopterin synthase catalytic subunit
LVYEAFTPMAEAELQRLLQEAAERHGLTAGVILHRLGEVAVGAASIAVAVSSPHRRSSFAAVAWIMDMVKTRVPIWKQEAFEDGSQEWVHPQEQAP